MNESHLLEAKRIMDSIKFPAQSRVVLEIRQEIEEPEPEFKRIAGLIEQDIALSATVLKIVNSPFWGLRKEITSPRHALAMLGLENFSNVILTSSLRDTVANPNMPENEFNKFFEHSLLVAKLCREISKDVIALSGQQYPGTAYLAGLFHDCGIPVLALRFPDYFNVVPGLYDQEKKLEWLEEERFETNHSVVGCLLVNTWKLPPLVRQAIFYHHQEDFSIHEDDELVNMISLVMLAEKIVAEQENKRNDGIPNIYTSMVSDACFEQIVTQLDLTGEQLVEFEELFDEISEVEL